MGNFKDDRQVYAVLGRLFQDALSDADLAPQFQRLDGVVQFQHRHPNATITIKAVKGEEPVVDLGGSELRPDVIVVMDADTAHGFWLGRVNATTALSKGQIKAKGPVDKVLRLIALVKPTHRKYAQLLVDLGAAAPEAVGAEPVAEDAGAEPVAEDAAAEQVSEAAVTEGADLADAPVAAPDEADAAAAPADAAAEPVAEPAEA